MRLKRVWVEIIVLLALIGCGKADVPSVGMEETEKTEEAEIIAEDEKLQDPVEMIPDADETEWEKVEGAYVKTVGSPYLGTSRWGAVLVTSQQEMDEVLEYEYGLQLLFDEDNVWKQSYSVSEYNYVVEKIVVRIYDYNSDAIEYCDSTCELRFCRDEQCVDIRDGKVGYMNIAAIPKNFFVGKTIEGFHTPAEWKDCIITVK